MYFPTPRRLAAAGLIALLPVLAACAAPVPEPEPAVPHGHIDGASELSEPRARLILIDPAGRVALLDLSGGDVENLPGGDAPRGFSADERFAYLDTEAGLRVIDGGSWTVDHGDHSHYYTAPARSITIPGTAPGPLSIAAAEGAAHVILRAAGSTQVLDREALGGPEAPGPRALEDDAIAPLGAGTVHISAGAVSLRGLAGEITQTCTDAGATASTRRGLVIDCAEGALILRDRSGTVSAQQVPAIAGERVTTLEHRPRGTVLAGLIPGGIRVLDLENSVWREIRQDGVRAVAVPDAETVLTLDDAGVLRSHSAAGGEPPVQRQLEILGTPSLVADGERAYVADSGSPRILEIDFRDGLRTARELPVGLSAIHVAQVGL